jgi:hypothetical protein
MIYIHRLAVLVMAQSLFIPLPSPFANSLCYSLESLLLTWNPSSCVVRSHPPWSQVACKLTSPSPTLPIPNSHSPQGFPKLIVRPTKTTSRSRLHIVRNSHYSIPRNLKQCPCPVCQLCNRPISCWGYYISLKLRWTILTNEISITCTYCLMFIHLFVITVWIISSHLSQ